MFVNGSSLGQLGQFLDKVVAPECSRVLVYVFKQFAMILRAWVSRHSDSFMNGVSCGLSIPRIDNESSVEALCSACKFGDDQSALSSLLAGDVFIRYLIETKMRGQRDDRRVA